ncbi:MAG: DoxX family protein [Lewinellaceae bacterium]|nr:DoxX family protein [Saprospiraceae bacterium]MCB9313882.1 DoxX family protein [Lewinellaceae bacterium]HRW76244.1 DoxX family protein [Saprospiraceae bacterium]
MIHPGNRTTDWMLLGLRLAFGCQMLAFHGWGKATKLLTGDPTAFADPFGWGPVPSLVLTVFAEGLCALLLILGLFTRWAAVPLIITMLVAVFIIHQGDPWGDRELGLLYLAGYLAIAVFGPGRYSLDEQWRGRS